MPIKLPKGFARRKSAGNVLDEGDAPQHPSFRVIERPSADRKSFSDGNVLSKRMSEGQLLRTPTEDQENIFAGQDHLHPSNSYDPHFPLALSSSERLTGSVVAALYTKALGLTHQFVAPQTGQLLIRRTHEACTTSPFLHCLVHYARRVGHSPLVGDSPRHRRRHNH